MLSDLPLATFDEWQPSAYLAEYYREVEPDEQHTLCFLVRALRQLRGRPTVLEFGVGPTIHHLLPLCPHAGEIHAADYLPANLAEVRRWLAHQPGAHDWRPFTECVLAAEGAVPSAEAAAQREPDLRRLHTRLLPCDAARPDPLGSAYRGQYGCVLTCFCADSATADHAEWEAYMRHIFSLLRPGGFFVTTALRRCRAYRVGERWFPGANVDETDLERLLTAPPFQPGTLTLEVAHVPAHAEVGYDEVVLASAWRRAD